MAAPKDPADKKAKAVKKLHRKQIRALPAPDRESGAGQTGFAVEFLHAARDTALLDVSRIQWQHGDWAELAKLTLDQLTPNAERARLALIVAAAHGQLGDLREARRFAAQALNWGCSATVVAQVLISSAYNTLGRAATCLQDGTAGAHFTAALQTVEPNSDLVLLSRSRQIRETTRLGLLPEAADLLAIELAEVAKTPQDHEARLLLLDQRMVQLKEELSNSRTRGQLSSATADDAVAPRDGRSNPLSHQDG